MHETLAQVGHAWGSGWEAGAAVTKALQPQLEWTDAVEERVRPRPSSNACPARTENSAIVVSFCTTQFLGHIIPRKHSGHTAKGVLSGIHSQAGTRNLRPKLHRAVPAEQDGLEC